MLNTSNSTKTTITLIEKLSKKNSHVSTKAVHAENPAVQKNTASAIRQDFCVEIYVSV